MAQTGFEGYPAAAVQRADAFDGLAVRVGTRPGLSAAPVYERDDSGWTICGRDTTVPRPCRRIRPSTRRLTFRLHENH